MREDNDTHNRFARGQFGFKQTRVYDTHINVAISVKRKWATMKQFEGYADKHTASFDHHHDDDDDQIHAMDTHEQEPSLCVGLDGSHVHADCLF